MSSALPITVVPSYPAPSWELLEEKLQQLSGVAAGFQVDVVSEEFAGTMSWPETEAQPINALSLLKSWTDKYKIELDLMVSDPERYFAVCAEIGIKDVVVHIHRRLDVTAVIKTAAQYGLSVSLGATADVALDTLEKYIKDGLVDSVQLMGIAVVGKQAQPFDDRVLPRTRCLREYFPELSIAVDGAVNSKTLPLLYAAGANRFAPGSAIIGSADPAAAYKQLVKQVSV